MDIKPFMKKRLIFAYEVSLPLMALFSLATLIALGSSYFHPERQPFVIYAVDHLIWLIFHRRPGSCASAPRTTCAPSR